MVKVSVQPRNKCRLCLDDVLQQSRASVVPVVRVVHPARRQRPAAGWVKVPCAVRGQFRHVHVAEERQQPVFLPRAATEPPHLSASGKVLIPQEINVSGQQDVRLHEDKPVGQQFPQLLNAHHVLRAPVVALVGQLPTFVGVFFKFLLEVDNLPPRVVDDGHAIHLSREWSAV